jgi:hypothetical protein
MQVRIELVIVHVECIHAGIRGAVRPVRDICTSTSDTLLTFVHRRHFDNRASPAALACLESLTIGADSAHRSMPFLLHNFQICRG